MQSVTLNRADVLTQQGIAALQGNDKTRAYDLLGQAVQIAPHNEQAWLWLSGTVTSDAERCYCLERVLVLNPHNTAAQRGMALLPATLPASPFPEETPPTPPTTEPELALVETVVSTTALAANSESSHGIGAAHGAEGMLQIGSLLDLIAQPDPVATLTAVATLAGPAGVLPGIELTSHYFSDSVAVEPAVVTFAPLPIGAALPSEAPPAPTSGGPDQAVVDFVIREYGRHRSRDEIVRTLSEQYHLAWSEAQELTAKVERENRRTIAVRQSPFFIFLGVATIIGGLFLAGRGIFVLYDIYFNTSLLNGAVRIPNPRAAGMMIGQMVTGVAMVLGATIGLGQTIKGLFK